MRLFTNETTNESILLNPADVWYYADKERLLGRRDITIYMHYRAYKACTPDFLRLCKYRGVDIVVVF